MKRKAVIILLVTLLLGTAGYVYRHTVLAKQRITQQVFGGQHLLDAFNAAEPVTAQRLYHREGHPRGSQNLDDYTRGETVPVAESQAREIKRLLQDVSSYNWSTDSAKSCILDYGVLLIFGSSQRPVRVALCFNCRDLGIYDGPDAAPRLVSGADFHPIGKQLVMLVKTIFPNDPEIQALR